jgi:hypothetical protein
MREITLNQAKNEIEVLDKISVGLQEAIRKNYEDLRVNNPAVKFDGGDVELAAQLHNNRLRMNEALEEVARRGYGRVVFVRELDEAGNEVRVGLYRVSQANAGLPETAIIARNGPLGSQIASCRVGEELEIRLPAGDKYFVVTGLIDLEGVVQLPRVPNLQRPRYTSEPRSGRAGSSAMDCRGREE